MPVQQAVGHIPVHQITPGPPDDVPVGSRGLTICWRRRWSKGARRPRFILSTVGSVIALDCQSASEGPERLPLRLVAPLDDRAPMLTRSVVHGQIFGLDSRQCCLEGVPARCPSNP